MSNHVSTLKITPKRLGLIAIKAYCARCFWYMLKQRFKFPFNHFGGAIFTFMEQAQMAVIGELLRRDGQLPKEFHPFENIVSRVEFVRHWSKFKYQLDSGVLLYGVPDEIVEFEDGSIGIIDHKTAHRKDGDDRMLPCYEIQGIGYGLIAEKGLDLGTTSRGGVMYWACQHEQVIAKPGAFYDPGKLWMPFVPQPLEYTMDYSRLKPLLKEAMKLWDASTPPARTEGCEDCELLDALMEIEHQANEVQHINDQRLLASTGNDVRYQNTITSRLFADKQNRLHAWHELADSALTEDGVVANWEYVE